MRSCGLEAVVLVVGLRTACDMIETLHSDLAHPAAPSFPEFLVRTIPVGATVMHASILCNAPILPVYNNNNKHLRCGNRKGLYNHLT